MVKQPYEQSLALLTRQLGNLGMRVLTTFALQTDQPFQTGCTCIHHGSGSCGCRMSVLMIYGNDPSPASIVVHGCEGTTWFSLVDNPQQPIEPQLREDIRRIIESVFPR